MTDPIRPEFKLVRDFDDGPIKKEHARLETPFSHYKSMGNFLDTQRHLTRKGVIRSGRNMNLSEILCLSLLSASLMKIGSKLKELAWRY